MSAVEAGGRHKWRGAPKQAAKLADLQAHLAAAAAQGDTHSQLASIEAFASGRARWLKLAAGDKAFVLAEALWSRCRSAEAAAPCEVALELGGFVGFSALRLARALAQAAEGREVPLARVISMEKDTGCALLAASMLSSAQCASAAEMWAGRAADLLPRVLEECGARSVGFAFFDHSGSVYHEDLAALEELDLLAPGAVIVADNVLKPGAPLFLWHVLSAEYDVSLISVREFVQTSIEDWVAVCVWRGNQPSGAGPQRAPAPLGLARLAWQADIMRRRSERSGVSVHEWASFAQQMHRALRQYGIEATPWRASVSAELKA